MLAQDHLSHRAQSSGVSYYWQLVAAKHPTVHGAALQQQNCLAPNVYSAKGEEGQLSEVRRGDGVRGYSVPHLGHIKWEILVLNCPWNHTA